MNQKAIDHLSKVDKKLGRLIKMIGPCTLRPKNGQLPYEPLVEAVVYQQLPAKAASAILGRFKELYPGKRFPSPSNVLDTRPEILRSVGLSRAKVEVIKDIAAKTIEGIVPSSKAIRKMDSRRDSEQGRISIYSRTQRADNSLNPGCMSMNSCPEDSR